MAKIKNIKARKILNSKGDWTVEVEVETDQGIFFASVPSGTSRGKYEAVEVEPEKAIENIEKVIAPKLRGEEITDQKKIDEILIELDGTENKSRLGANSILAVSIACLRAGAAISNLPLFKYISHHFKLAENSSLPAPCFNILNGGAHAGNDLDIQEFMIVPQQKTFKENLRVGVEVYYQLKEILKKKFGESAINLGDEGGFAPPLKKTKEALDLIMEAIKEAEQGEEIRIGLDAAASQFYKQGRYNFEGKKLTGEELSDFYLNLVKQYPILFLEDPFSQDDWFSWQSFNQFSYRERSHTMVEKGFFVVGDDLTVTSPERIKIAKEKKACNGVIIKPNQIGTVTETFRAAKLAREFDFKIIVSHRSAETCDDFISDLSVGIGADFIKAGAPARGERVVKYNRLLEIEESILRKS